MGKLDKRSEARHQRMGDAKQRHEDFSAARLTFQRAARESRAKPANGLVVAAYLAVRRDGRIVQLNLPGIAPANIPKRGECEGMSEDSQRRLLVMLHSIRRDAALPVMVTLTFPEELKVTAREAKACRAAFEKRMRREFGEEWCAVWRLEAHPEMSYRLSRMHPHIHMLTWGAFYDFEKVGKDWQECVFEVLAIDPCLADSEGRLVSEKHRAAGTNCERIRQWSGVLYSAKNYIAKREEFPLGKASGRVWGWHNRKALPLAEEERIPLTHTQAAQVVREVEAWQRERRIVTEHLVCTFFDDNPDSFVHRLLRSAGPALPPTPMPIRPCQ